MLRCRGAAVRPRGCVAQLRWPRRQQLPEQLAAADAWQKLAVSRGSFKAASSVPSMTPLGKYNSLLASGELNKDPRQEVTMAKLETLYERLKSYTPPAWTPSAKAAPAASGGGWLGGLFGGGQKAPAAAAPVMPKLQGPQGLYLWGGTGTGKTFMMDLFYETLPIGKKKRIHFHEWMIDVHGRLHKFQKQAKLSGQTSDDLVVKVAEDMLAEASVLCFDEFQVTHISDAIILKRIFAVLFERGAVVVATSNRPPEDLYLNGLNRPLFLPFIPMLREFCEVHDIGNAVDYRLISTRDGQDDSRVFISPDGDAEKALLEQKFKRLCGGQGDVLKNAEVEAQGRRISVPRAGKGTSVAWFDFADLCDRPLGAADYLAVASAFHTVFIKGVPLLTLQERDQVRRLITLIDTLYERHTKLVCTAAADPMSLFQVSDKDRQDSVADEIFAWDRTVSRLTEMQSTKYLSESARRVPGDQFIGQFDLRSLCDSDVAELWHRYDQDDSGELDQQELRLLLEDIQEKQVGHRHLSDDAFEVCLSAIDTDKNRQVSYEEFQVFFKDFGRVSSTMSF